MVAPGVQASCRRRAPGDSAVAPWNVTQLQQTGYGAHGPAVTVVEKVLSDEHAFELSAHGVAKLCDLYGRASAAAVRA
jgi:hypothetical protein